ncbi:hypothetical protein [uncultured Flavobacterium sp.]|uniref:hypothetical protein n=1 Tax=uncultured Flavobacterium sp. TaxID=165435 RepID=UPI003081A740
MKKLKLKNLKVITLTSEEKKVVEGGKIQDLTTSHPCNETSGPYVSWCHGC